MQKIKVLLVDDHELVRTGIALLLKDVEGIVVVGIASCGEQALSLTAQLCPDVILMDIYMPGIGGVEACRRILHNYPNVKIIALSAYNNGLLSGQLSELGSMGFISKNSSVDEMVSTIRKVMAGEPYSAGKTTVQSTENSPFAKLSKREVEVSRLILQGRDIHEMAKILNVNVKTINTYRYRLHKKLNIKNDAELFPLAVKWNYY